MARWRGGDVNYYNDNDPKAAAWLRELIKQNLIPPGDVDERSIEDVTKSDLRGD
jgi:DNA (cytosine-5)-methyltransferase 1